MGDIVNVDVGLIIDESSKNKSKIYFDYDLYSITKDSIDFLAKQIITRTDGGIFVDLGMFEHGMIVVELNLAKQFKGNIWRLGTFVAILCDEIRSTRIPGMKSPHAPP